MCLASLFGMNSKSVNRPAPTHAHSIRYRNPVKTAWPRITRLQPAGLLLAALLFSPAIPAHENHEAHERILDAATRFMLAEARMTHGERFQVDVIPGRLDPRLRLRRCEHEPQAFLGPGSRMAGNATVGVRCPGPVSWTLYVPVRITVQGDVLVLSQPLPRGSLLQDSSLRLERHDVGSLPGGYLDDMSAARNMVLRRALPAGTVLTPQMVEPQRLVQRGQRVTLLAEGGTIAVRVEGEALAHGSQGERIRVRNLSSRRVVEGTVLSHGIVGVNM